MSRAGNWRNAPLSPAEAWHQSPAWRATLVSMIASEHAICFTGGFNAMELPAPEAIALLERLDHAGDLKIDARSHGWTLLHDCALRGAPEVFAWLVWRGANAELLTEPLEHDVLQSSRRLIGWSVADLIRLSGKPEAMLVAARAHGAMQSVLEASGRSGAPPGVTL